MSSNLSNNNEITPMENPESPIEEVGNWLELPRDLMRMILMKVSPFDILEYAQFVCKKWYNLCKEPALWRTIHIQTLDEQERVQEYKRMIVNAVNRSAGGLIDLSIEGFGSDELFSHVASQASQLKRLRLACCDDISGKAFIEALESLLSLEELDLTLCDFQGEAAVPIINSCPSLTTFKFNQMGSKCPDTACDYEALAIAGNMPELRHLQLIGNSLTDVGLTAILDGCPHLQSLDLRACFHVELDDHLDKKLLEQIKDFRRPYDSTDDYDYRMRYYNYSDSSDEDYAYDFDYMTYMSDDDPEYELDYFD